VASLGIATLRTEVSLEGLKRGLATAQAQTKQSFAGMASTATTLLAGIGVVAGAGAAIKKLADDASAFHLAMKDLSTATGVEVEQISRLIQVGDDFRVSQGTMTKALEMAVKNGFLPTIDNLATLSDHLLSIPDPTKRAAEAAKIFGKGWADVAPFLLSGGNAIRANSAAVNESLVTTKEAAKRSEEYFQAVDTLNDSLQGLALTAGTGVIPAFIGIVDSLNRALIAAQQLGFILNWIDYTVLPHDTDAWKEAAAVILDFEGALGNVGSELHGLAEEVGSAFSAVPSVVETSFKATFSVQVLDDYAQRLLDQGLWHFFDASGKFVLGAGEQIVIGGGGAGMAGGGGGSHGYYKDGVWYPTATYEQAVAGAGGQHGLDMIVPPGFPNDSFPIMGTSGERVQITPEGAGGGAGGPRVIIEQVILRAPLEVEELVAVLERL